MPLLKFGCRSCPGQSSRCAKRLLALRRNRNGMAGSSRDELFHRVVGLRFALEMALYALAAKSGQDASTIESLRDKAVHRFKNSDIRREWGIDHAARPATEIIAAVFDAVLRDLHDREAQH